MAGLARDAHRELWEFTSRLMGELIEAERLATGTLDDFESDRTEFLHIQATHARLGMYS